VTTILTFLLGSLVGGLLIFAVLLKGTSKLKGVLSLDWSTPKQVTVTVIEVFADDAVFLHGDGTGTFTLSDETKSILMDEVGQWRQDGRVGMTVVLNTPLRALILRHAEPFDGDDGGEEDEAEPDDTEADLTPVDDKRPVIYAEQAEA
jgi:quinol monooxygenase YgiN